MVVWVVIAVKIEIEGQDPSPSMTIQNKTRGWTNTYSLIIDTYLKICGAHSSVCHIPLKKFEVEVESGDEIEVSIKGNDAIEVKKCGIHLLVNEPDVLVEYGSNIQHIDRKSTRLNSSHGGISRMPSSA